MDVTIAWATAQFIRPTTPAIAILVPLMALLDRWVMVIFMEKILGENLVDDPTIFIDGVIKDSIFEISEQDI